jgi:hypothetical protein
MSTEKGVRRDIVEGPSLRSLEDGTGLPSPRRLCASRDRVRYRGSPLLLKEGLGVVICRCGRGNHP